tara:strand:- start:170 stop:1051 length:882 start_codon:yes stop_codon:yes gene_type:complete
MKVSLFHKILPNFIRFPLALFLRKSGITAAVQTALCISESKRLAATFTPTKSNHSNSKVLIVCAHYNHLNWLPGCVDSVLAQTHPNWQLIIVDDASTDPNTLHELTTQTSKDSRIKAIQLENNSGAYIARNTALQAADPDWTHITFIDPDDEAYTNWLSHLLDVLGTHQGTVLPVLERWTPDFSKRNSMYFGHCQSLHSKKTWKLLGGFLPVRVSADAELTLRTSLLSKLGKSTLHKSFNPAQKMRSFPSSSSHQALRERKLWLERRYASLANPTLKKLCITPTTSPWRDCNP